MGKRIVNFGADRTSLTDHGLSLALGLGDYGNQYLLRAAMARAGRGANYFADAVYAGTFVDGDNATLNDAKKYTVTFQKDQLPPAHERPGHRADRVRQLVAVPAPW